MEEKTSSNLRQRYNNAVGERELDAYSHKLVSYFSPKFRHQRSSWQNFLVFQESEVSWPCYLSKRKSIDIKTAERLEISQEFRN